MRGFSLTLAHGAGCRFWNTAGVPASDLTTRPATSADVDAVLAFWERAAENADRPADSAGVVTRLVRIDAMVLESNQSARELWSRAGYTRQSNWARWVKPIARRVSGA
jgi:hypothetical protein